jgi:transcriptional regulator with XRE-family HTH domain
MRPATLTADSPSRDVLAVNVRRLRMALGLTQTELALKLGNKTHILVTGIENSTKPPVLDTVDRLAAALGVTPADLLTPPAEAGGPS